MLEFSGHRQNAGTQRVTGGAYGIGSLFGMSALDALPTARTVAGLDVELGDDGHDWRQIGLVLRDDLRIDQFHMAVWTEAARDVEGAVDLFWGRRGPQLGLMPWATPGFFLASFQLAAAEVPGLPVRLAVCFVEFLAEAVVVLFQLGQAALLATIVVCQLVDLTSQARQLALAHPTAAAVSDRRKHGEASKDSVRERLRREVFCRAAPSS
jgi:hypothetical protein